MAINAEIPLLARTGDFVSPLFQGYASGQQIRQQREEAPLRQQLLQGQVDNQASQSNAFKRDQFNDEQISVIKGSSQLKPLIDANDIEGVRNQLTQRRQSLTDLGLNTAHTDEALALLDKDPAQLKKLVDANVSAGFQSGVLTQPKTPDHSSLFGKATPESIQKFNQTGNYADLQMQPETITPYQQAQLDNERAKISIDREKLKQGPDGEKTFKQATDLRKEFIAQSKDYSLQNDALGRIAASAKDPSAAGDLSLIFNYMKMLDPGSTVREGEFATAQNAGGIPDRAVAAYNKVLSGERLAPAQRTDFVGQANKIFSQAKRQHQKRESEYSRLAKQNGIDPTNVVVDFSTYQPEQEGLPTQAPSNQQGSGIQPGQSVQINGVTIVRKR